MKQMIAMNHKFSRHKKRVKQLNPSINIIEMRAARNIRQIMACVPVNILFFPPLRPVIEMSPKNLPRQILQVTCFARAR